MTSVIVDCVVCCCESYVFVWLLRHGAPPAYPCQMLARGRTHAREQKKRNVCNTSRIKNQHRPIEVRVISSSEPSLDRKESSPHKIITDNGANSGRLVVKLPIHTVYYTKFAVEAFAVVIVGILRLGTAAWEPKMLCQINRTA